MPERKRVCEDGIDAFVYAVKTPVPCAPRHRVSLQPALPELS